MKKLFFTLFATASLLSAFAQDGYPDFDMKENPFPPLVSFSSVLNELAVTYQGRTDISLYIAFLPTKTTSGEPLKYSGKNAYIHIKISNNDNFVEDVPMKEGAHKGIFTQFTAACIMGNYDCYKNLAPGKIKYATYLGNTLINEFEFDVVKKSTDDIYAKEKDFLFPMGPWQKYAMIYAQASDGNLIFNKFFIYDTAATNAKKYFDCTADLYKDGVMINKKESSPRKISLINTAGIAKYNTTFSDPVSKGYFKVTSLKDGKYTIKSYVGGKAQSYDFVVAGGKIVPPAYMDLKTNKDYPHLIFGDKDEYYLVAK